jgi:hypothetical protein
MLRLTKQSRHIGATIVAKKPGLPGIIVTDNDLYGCVIDMRIYIPSRGRSHKQITQIPEAWRDRTCLVVHEDEHMDYEHFGYDILAHREIDIPSIREHIKIYTGEDHILMIDDDVKFHRRDENAKLITPPVDKLVELFDHIEHLLENELWVGVGMMKRAFARDPDTEFLYGGPMAGVFGFNARVAIRDDLCFNKGGILVSEDHMFNLTLLTKGHTNIIFNQWAFSAGQHTEGGCGIYRTPQIIDESYETLHRLFPDYVKPTGKYYPTGNQRYRIAWAKISKDHDICGYRK